MVATAELGPLEMRVLGLVERRGTASVGDVLAELEREGDALAYTTVMTVLSRLHDKGVIRRRREGRRFVYSLARGSELLKARIVKRLRSALFPGRGTAPLTALLDASELSRDDLRELRRWVDARLKAKGE
ncbi:MAG TPA: BlaI/MecI/CopY family transcriptional regulator [Polyangiaceae bacterium]|nr:BlaI/MecI/CopY family transcriptional regulator [Polyangiaceae bacterium]